MYAAIPTRIVVGRRALPNDLIDKVRLAKDLIQSDLHVMHFAVVKVNIHASVISKQVPQEHQPLAKEFYEHCASNLVLIRLLVLTASKLLFGRKRWIDVHQPYARSAVSVDKFPSLLHLKQSLQRLQVRPFRKNKYPGKG